MKVVLLHGLGVTSSRTQLINIKSKFNNNNTIIFGNSSSEQELYSALHTLSLISESRLYILENLQDSLFLENLILEEEVTLVFWYDKQLDEKNKVYQFVKVNNGDIKLFSESTEVTIFPFLDYLGNKDKRAFLELNKIKKIHFDIQYIIVMIFYLLRTLSVSSKGPEFVRKKIAKQQKNFTPTQVENLYKDVLEVDYKFKNGLLDDKQAEFLLINSFISTPAVAAD